MVISNLAILLPILIFIVFNIISIIILENLEVKVGRIVILIYGISAICLLLSSYTGVYDLVWRYTTAVTIGYFIVIALGLSYRKATFILFYILYAVLFLVLYSIQFPSLSSGFTQLDNYEQTATEATDKDKSLAALFVKNGLNPENCVIPKDFLNTSVLCPDLNGSWQAVGAIPMLLKKTPSDITNCSAEPLIYSDTLTFNFGSLLFVPAYSWMKASCGASSELIKASGSKEDADAWLLEALSAYN